MKNINQTIEIGHKKDLTVERVIEMDGEVVDRGYGHSILGSFLVTLNWGMTKHQNSINRVRVFERNTNTVSVNSVDTSVVPAELNLASNMYLDSGSNIRQIFVMDNVDEPELSGTFRHKGNDSSPNTVLLQKPSFNSDGTYAGATDLDLTGTSITTPSEIYYSKAINFYNSRDVSNELTDAVVNIGTNNTPNSILYPQSVVGVDPAFDISGRTVNSPTETDHTATIEISADFTNNYGQDITIEEIALLARNSGDLICVGRELNQITISDSSTANIYYRFIASNNNGSGGLMTHFIRAIYRHLYADAATIDLIDASSNTSHHYSGDWHLCAVGPGGVGGTEGGFNGSDYGPVVGTNSNSVNNSQVSLASRVPHGTGTGELIHHGSYSPQPMTRDHANNTYSFDIVRIFENRSGGPIDLNETGLYANIGGSNVGVTGPTMFARHVLGSTQTVADGEILELTYTFEVNV